jgi:selenide, water dikinase
MTSIKLTQYSHGSGCGCKIAPGVLEKIIQTKAVKTIFPNLIIGNDTCDDAAVMDWGNDEAVISTTDFFMPIVDDPFQFGQIAAINAMSDIYAMGGTPMMAIAILGWPIDKIPVDIAGEVLNGGRAACEEAGIPLAGGHSIDSPEPIFGLAVTGRVKKSELKTNAGAKEEDLIYLTKPIGIGILTTAEKKKLLKPEHAGLAVEQMLKLNGIGIKLASLSEVHALTDVTGFGLFGHLNEMAKGSKLTAGIDFDRVPLIGENALKYYIGKKAVPGGTYRNFDSYGGDIAPVTEFQKIIGCDPQTSGGLLIAVDKGRQTAFEKQMKDWGIQIEPIGRFMKKDSKYISVV